jgi:hypothetical protein
VRPDLMAVGGRLSNVASISDQEYRRGAHLDFLFETITVASDSVSVNPGDLPALSKFLDTGH